MKSVFLVVICTLGILGARVALGQGGFAHPGGNVTLSDGTAGKIHPGGAVTFSDGTSGFVHPGGAVTTSDGRAGFLHPGGTLSLPPKSQKVKNSKPQTGADRKPIAKEEPGKQTAREIPQMEQVWEKTPKTKKVPKQPGKAKFIEIHSDGTVTESYH